MSDQCAGGHDKVYSTTVLMSLPPIHPWICRRCLAEGLDRGITRPFNEYEELKRRKEEGCDVAQG